MLQKTTIRPLQKNDAKAFREIRLEALQGSPASFGGKYEDERAKPLSYWEELIDKDPGESVVLCAEQGEKMVGTLFCFLREKNIAGFGGMWVNPSFRNQGIASALVTKGLEWSKQNGAKKISFWVTENNEPSLNFYKKLGFRPNGNMRPLESDSSLKILEFEKNL